MSFEEAKQRMDEFFNDVRYNNLPWVSKAPVDAAAFISDDRMELEDEQDIDDVISDMFNLDD